MIVPNGEHVSEVSDNMEAIDATRDRVVSLREVDLETDSAKTNGHMEITKTPLPINGYQNKSFTCDDIETKKMKNGDDSNKVFLHDKIETLDNFNQNLATDKVKE